MFDKIESLEEFYKSKFSELPESSSQPIGDFNVFVIEDVVSPQGEVTIKYTRRDFYKICLITGSNLFHYADKTIQIEGTSLIFFNPQTPYKWEALSKESTGYFCVFKDAFFMEKLKTNLADLPMFSSRGKATYDLNPRQTQVITEIFLKMLDEMESDYKYKQDLLVSYVTEIIHITLKMEPSESVIQHADAKARVTSLFTELLERQFPINPGQPRFALRSARAFADELFLHVNYLNAAVKETTGKTTSNLIAERIALEAKIMLKHTQLNISEIGYALGFEDPSHFNNFFKKHTDTTPSKYRLA